MVIRTPDQRLRVFVSSTLQELADERASTKEAIEHIRLTPVMFETSARPHPPRDLYRAYLAQSDIFIGIYWQRYGWVAPNESVSGLEDEFVLAQQMPKLIYIKRADRREDRLNDLINRIRDEDRVSYRPFSDAAELKDLVENDLALMLTEHFAAGNPGLIIDSPTDQMPDVPPRSLAPIERGELIGRESEVQLIAELIQRPDTGLTTLTGPGGTGKTRLATHLANSLGGSFSDGVFYVPLAGVRNPADLVPTITSTLEVPSPPSGGDPEKLLVGFLRARHALLVLDNVEQVLDAAGHVTEMLGVCPHLKILATSREPLHIRGEREVPIPPLPHAFAAGGDTTPAMRLFEERAREVRPDFAIDNENRVAVAELCRRLDALPLAIELAAARARVLSPQAIVSRLDDSLSLLSGTARGLPQRHQTLRATLEWSLDLLEPEERLFFWRLGTFADSFSEAAAAAVSADAGPETLDGLTSLVEKSLLVCSEVRTTTRFQMLQTVREFARQQLAAAGEERAARLRHGEWVVQFLASEHHNLTSSLKRQAAHQRIVSEEVEARHALRFAASADGDSELAWQLFIRFGFALMVSYAHTAEVLEMYKLVAPLPRPADPLQAAIALGVWSVARANMFDLAAAADLEAACATLEEAGDRDFLACGLTGLGMLLAPGSLPSALVILDRSLALARASDQTHIENWTLATICNAHLYNGSVEEAKRYGDEFARIAQARHDDEAMAYALAIEARVNLTRGDVAAARTLFADAAALATTRSNAWARAVALCGLASVTLAEGDDVGARAALEEALVFCVGIGYVSIDSLCGSLALLLARSGQPDRALRVFNVVAADAETQTDFSATLADPGGALRTATGEARALLGNPQPHDAHTVDLDEVLQAALGHPPQDL